MRIVKAVNDFYYHMALYELQIMNEDNFYYGLSYNSLLYLNVIEQMKDCTVSKLAEALHVTKSAVTLKINELVKIGAVEKKQSDADKRVFYLRLSPHMADTCSIYDKIFEKIEQKLEKQYTKEQLEEFAQILHTISGYEWREIE